MKTLLLALLLALPASAQPAVEVTLVSARLVRNDHVGNEWSTSVKVGSQTLLRGQVRRVHPDDEGHIVITATAIEDEKYPDYGSNSIGVNVEELTGKGRSVTLDVVVREDRGRYKGNTATWRFEVRVRREGG